jgi:DNA-binding NarL/FixJ family response regulator
MTLLEAPEVLSGAMEDWATGNPPAPAEISAPGAPATRRYRAMRNAGFARLDELERRALDFVAEGAAPVGAVAHNLEAIFAETRDLLAKQLAELDHCLRQAYGARSSGEMPTLSGAGQPGFDRLTGAEKRVFVELAKGKPNKIIAFDLAISEATVKAHVSKILKKLKVHSRNRAIALFAARPAE